MHLQSISFTENSDSNGAWLLDSLAVAKKNLIVGKNSTGKSRAISVIAALSDYLFGTRKLAGDGMFDCHFSSGYEDIRYQLKYKDSLAIFEEYAVGSNILLTRDANGEGEIHAAQISNGSKIRFQTPTEDIAALSRRDLIQHPFLEELNSWAASVRCYRFGSSFGKDNYTVIVPDGPKVDDRNTNSVVGIFRDGIKKHADQFKRAIIEDFNKLGYSITDIYVGAPLSIRLEGFVGEILAIIVKESDLKGVTDQGSMSAGMFRVLSLIIQLNYGLLESKLGTLLIDDIGEGLDFERSCLLIDLLRGKCENSNLQLVMTTNDRFVMNRVPLEEWTILQRVKNKVIAKNLENSRKQFEDFKFTGLSNFSFFEFDAVNQPIKE